MDLNQSSRSVDARNLDDLGTSRRGRHARPGDTSFDTIPDLARERRTAERIAAAERILADMHARARGAGGDPDSLATVFAIASDCLAEVRELAQDVSIAHYEWERTNLRRQDPSRYTDTATPVVPDIPGLSLCPDPSSAQTPEAFVDTLRMYRIWAGKPSYRVMEHQCARRFAASTIHAALKSNDLPSLEMVQAIITGCRGSDQHRHAFASAWRRLVMAQPDAAYQPQSRALYPVSETALAQAGIEPGKSAQAAEMLRLLPIDPDLPQGRRLNDQALARPLAPSQAKSISKKSDNDPKNPDNTPKKPSEGGDSKVVPIRPEV